MSYIKKPEDVKYRIVSLKSAQEPEFIGFSGNEVDYRGAVLEVLKNDGSTVIEYDGRRLEVLYGVFEDKFYIPKGLPTARLWVRAIDGKGLWYKVPMQLETQDDRAYILISGGIAHLELCGDAYFDAVYRLIRT